MSGVGTGDGEGREEARCVGETYTRGCRRSWARGRGVGGQIGGRGVAIGRLCRKVGSWLGSLEDGEWEVGA